MENVDVIASKSWWRDSIKLLRSLHNIKLVFGDGTTDRALYSDNDITLRVPGASSQSTGSARLATYRVKSVPTESEYLVCRTWDGTNEGAIDINVAKPFEARQPASETLAGVVVSYVYSAGPDGLNDFRQATGTDIDEQQIVIPYWYVNCLIKVASINYTGVSVSGSPLTLIEVSSRCWAGPAT